EYIPPVVYGAVGAGGGGGGVAHSGIVDQDYNHDRQLDFVTRADGGTIDYQYDAEAGRLNKVALGGGTEITYTYYPDTGQLRWSDTQDTRLAYVHKGGALE